MRSSILALLAGPIVALASPALRVSVTVDGGIDTDFPSQGILTTNDPGNYPTYFMISAGNDLIVSPEYAASGKPLTLNYQSNFRWEIFALQNNGLYTISGSDGTPPFKVFSTSSGGPPTLVLGPLDGGPNLQPVKVGAFPSDDGDEDSPVLLQIDPSTGDPKPFYLLGSPNPGTPIATQGETSATLRIEPTS